MPYKRILRWCFEVALHNLKPGVAALEIVSTRGDPLSLLPINYLAKSVCSVDGNSNCIERVMDQLSQS